ncbi:MAG: neutral/alkaline non-lysosomal ceramidase N-terminal domain-containing protein [Mariniblastus sp.]|nr:neutral/alkaline non-lysosomal ceramidase N-terminal domain-containing protein [Mariniblastus sp.]
MKSNEFHPGQGGRVPHGSPRPDSNQAGVVFNMVAKNLSLFSVALILIPVGAWAQLVQVGSAKLDITPSHPTLLAGYGGRPGEHAGIDTRLWARALAIGEEKPVVLVAVDNCGVPAKITEVIQRELAASHQLAAEQVVIASTHTHNAPTLNGYAPVVWGSRVTPQQTARTDRYTQWLVESVCQVAEQALDARQPATLSWGQGRLAFGGNRRVLANAAWRGFGLQADGPVDHSLPVMVARNAEGAPIVVWTNYACHCTTVGSRNRVSGDWAGHANAALERRYPAAISLTTIGCGADIGPQPSGSLVLAQQHGEALADEVARLLGEPLESLAGAPTAARRDFDLPLADPPDRAFFEQEAEGSGYHADRARSVLDYEKRHGEIQSKVPYTVSCWKFGEDLAIVFLAGEVVVDYSVRLKTELDWRRLWLNGWCNDVPSYIPSRRVLAEGGYEADFSQVYYALPGPYAPELEDQIVQQVTSLVGPHYENREPHGDAPDFLTPPTVLERFANSIESWQANLSPELRRGLEPLGRLSGGSINGYQRLLTENPQRSRWYNYSGDQTERPFIRQTDREQSLKWITGFNTGAGPVANFLFSGGLGWQSEPATGGFEMVLGGQQVVELDVTRHSKSWQSVDGQVQLDYLVTWQSDIDSGGLFYLKVPRDLLDAKGGLTVEVRSLGSGSQRWFALDDVPTAKQVEHLILEALKRNAQ